MQNYARCKITQGAKLCKGHHSVRCKIMQGVHLCKVQDYRWCKIVPSSVTRKAWAPKAPMLMHNSGQYVRLCVHPTILICSRFICICFLDLLVLYIPKFLNKLCIYRSNGLWSGATSISDGIFMMTILDDFALVGIFLVESDILEIKLKKSAGGYLLFNPRVMLWRAG